MLTFFRSMGGAIGVSALGAVLASKVTSGLTEKLGAPAGGGSGTAEVPDLANLPGAGPRRSSPTCTASPPRTCS